MAAAFSNGFLRLCTENKKIFFREKFRAVWYTRTMKLTRDQLAADEVGIRMTLEEAKRIRAALSDLDGEDLDGYGGILEVLRKAIPQQWAYAPRR